MKRYFVHGGCLHSDIPLPELSETDCVEADWILSTQEAPADGSHDVERRLLGEKTLAPGWVLRLWEHDRGHRLDTGQAGIFDIGRDDEILWSRGDPRHDAFARSAIIGPVLALALNSDGVLCLHGSAVGTADGVIGFLAPKFHGKSTLALALVSRGCGLVTDDMLCVRTGVPPTALPGVHSLRLRTGTLEEWRGELPGSLTDGSKQTVTRLPRSRLAWSPQPLSALYVLTPHLRTSEEERLERARVNPSEAAVVLAAHAKLSTELTGLAFAAQSLPRIALVVRSVPVYRLSVPWSFDGLPAVTDQLLDWHGGVRTVSEETRSKPLRQGAG